MQTNMNMTGRIKAVLRDEHGNIKQEFEGPNMVVTAGKTWLMSRATSATADVMSHMAVGSSNTAENASQTALVAQTAIVALTSSTPSGAQVTYVATFGAGVGTGTIAEAGLFNAASAGTMLARTISVNMTKGATDSLTVTWVITVN